MSRPFAAVRRPSLSSQQGYGAEHRAWRLAVLERDPVCRWPGCRLPASHADHVVPWKHGGAQFDVANGQGLCQRHHSVKTVREVNGRRSARRPPERHPGEAT